MFKPITLTTGKDISGDFQGTLTVEGEDNDGNPVSFSLPLQLTVEKPAVSSVTADTVQQKNEQPTFLIYALAGGCGLLFLILLLQGILLRRKIHQLEEDKL